MATGDHDWTAGEQVTAANMDDYLMLQALQQFATAAARDTALSARKRENMVTAQADVNTLTVYSGAAWSTIGPVHGALTTYTPTLTQSGAVTKTVNYASYMRVGRMVIGSVQLTCTGSGTGANAVLVGTPVAAVGAGPVVGAGYILDVSAGIRFAGTAYLAGGSSIAIISGNAAATAALGISQFTAALASPDEVYVCFQYEAAADA